MSIISYEEPEEIKHDPVSYEGKSFPYNMVSDHRRFEELIYSIFKIKIARSEFPPYDAISLMNGVRDQGRDCVLLKDGRNYGLIQCKKYDKSFSKDMLGREMTKFVLYSLLDQSLIWDRHQFEYYIAISGAFANDCTNFIDQFKDKIASEPKLSGWITENLKLPTLAPLKLNNPTAQVIDILSAINVKKILPEDLDALLFQPAVAHITPLFFQVRSVTDNSHIIGLKDDFRRFANKVLNKQEIESALLKGSGSLKFQNNEIEEIPDSHIERSETAQLIQWVLADLEKDKTGRDKNICLLAGDAGIGKTVILKDLYDELAKKDIPVLALKADKLYPANMQDLQAKINLSMPLFDFIEQCKQQFDTTVILIDQIDALSQSMSSDRNYLHVFRQLIDNFTYDSNVRIIISVRTFDLEYDPTLKIYKDIKKIKVSQLSEAEVRAQLAKIKFPDDALSPKLLLLLRTPNHLNIFSIVYAKRTAPMAGFSSIQELYSELWLQKIVHTANSGIEPEQLKSVLYLIVAKMFAEQRISVNRQQFEVMHREIAYLESERILKVDGKQIQFFHQSFYDYVFARNFVESRRSLSGYIKTQKQSILIRSAVKMIVNYLRDFDHERYIRDFTGLLKSQSIYFHVKHLLISMFSVIEDPTEQEIWIFIKYISRSVQLKTVFFEHAYGNGWTATVLKNGVLDFLIDEESLAKPALIRRLLVKYLRIDRSAEINRREYLRHVCTLYLRNQLSVPNAIVLDFVLRIKDQNLLRWLAFTLNDWSDPKALLLFKKCVNFREVDPYGYFHTLENMGNGIPDFAFEQIRDLLFTEEYFPDDRNADYHSEINLIKVLTAKIPFVVAGQLLHNIDAVINNERYKELGFNGDFKYKDVYLRDETDLDNPGLLYKLLANCLRKAAAEKHDIFKRFIADFGQDINDSYLRLLIFGYDSDAGLYAPQISNLLHHLNDKGLLHHEGRLNVEFRALFEKAFPYFSVKDKQKALALLEQLVISDEIHVYQRGDKKYHHLTVGLTKYFFLKRLPAETLAKYKHIRKQFQELDRKFRDKADRIRSQSNIAQTVGRPLSLQAYAKMGPAHWISSFKKYNSDDSNSGRDFLKGGLHEHSWAFKEYLSKNATKQNIDLVTAIIADDEINPTYKVRALYGLSEAKVSASILLPLVEAVMEKNQFHADRSLFLSVIGDLFQSDCYNDKLVEFVVNEALTGETPKNWAEKESYDKTSVNGLVTSAINSSKGKAAEYLVYIETKKYGDRVFETIDLLLQNGSPQVRAVIYFRYAFLMRVDGERAFTLFEKHLVKEENEEVLASAIWSLRYLANYDFERLRPIFHKLTHIKNLGDDDRRGALTILFIACLKAKAGAKELYTEFVTVNEETHFWAVHEAFEHFYLFEDSPQKCLDILFFLLKIAKPEEGSKGLKFQLYKLENIRFADVKSLLYAFVNSPAFRLTEDLTRYLIIACKDNPFECVDLFSCAISKKKDPAKNDRLRDNDHVTQFIVAGFSAIKGNDSKSIKYRKKLLKSFDRVLSDYRFRNKAEKILDAV